VAQSASVEPTYNTAAFDINDRYLQKLRALGAETLARDTTLKIALPSDQLFEFDHSRLLRSGYPLLDLVIAELAQFPKDNIVVTGYTDATSYNDKKLTSDQVTQVVGYFWTHNIPNRITQQTLRFTGKGKANPIAANEEFEGMTLNRRIEVTISVPEEKKPVTEEYRYIPHQKKPYHPYQKTYGK
jgi:outer membrane protein OmpA-like peptidoglycan-associated protein